jgi:hypothetical protein
MERELDRHSRQLGQNRSEVVRDALRRQLSLLRFDRLRRGLLTDEEPSRDAS